MTFYAWIAIALSAWLGVAALFGLVLGRLIAFGAGNHGSRAPRRSQRGPSLPAEGLARW
jgi:hypothetical protein